MAYVDCKFGETLGLYDKLVRVTTYQQPHEIEIIERNPKTKLRKSTILERTDVKDYTYFPDRDIVQMICKKGSNKGKQFGVLKFDTESDAKTFMET